MNILVTGANGYLGGGLVARLESEGHRVNKLDGHCNVSGVYQFPAEQTQCVVHLAWCSKVGNGERGIQEKCFLRTKRLLQECMPYKPHFILASSAAVYGEGRGPCKESTRVNPNCHYSHFKALAEVELGKCLRQGLPATAFRFGSLMGRGMTRTKPDLIVNAFAIDAYRRKRVEVWNPDCFKPVLHVADAISLLSLAVRMRWMGMVNACYGSFQASDIGKCVAKLAAEATSVGCGLKEVDGPAGAPKKSCILDCTRLSGFLRKAVPPFAGFKTVDQTVKEFAEYEPGPMDETRAWNN